MVIAINRALDAFEADPAVGSVVIASALDGTFCAGGDVRSIRELVLAGRKSDAVAFFRDEYRLNLRLSDFPKPMVSIIDGTCMGGGLGLSVHGTFRVATPRACLAMPETRIGFVPDVGSSYFLSRLGGHVGLFLGLTGYALGVV